MVFRFLSALAVLALMACTSTQTAEIKSTKSEPSVLVMGDSLFAANRMLSASVALSLEDLIGLPVKDHSTIGARYFYNLPITGSLGLKLASQYPVESREWVVMNGGGNDILFGCGCGKCDDQLNRLITADGQKGAIPDLVAKIRAKGTKVIYAGYLRTPGIIAPVETCGPMGDEMDRRLARMANTQSGVWFVAMSDLVPEGDRSFHGLDLIHPSAKGSRAIASRIAGVIRAN